MNINIHGSDIQACRVCLATDVKLISLLDLNLKRMYSEFSGVPTMATDGLPQHICVYCCAMLKKSSKFRKKCEATYYLLLEHLLEKQDLTTTYFNTIDTSHLRIAMDTTAIVNYNYIPDKLLSIKEEICEMEERADEPCSTYDDEIYATGTHDGNDVLERKESEKYKNSKYKCELCYTGFSVEKSFQNHKALHDPSRPYECEYCHLRFKDGRSRRKHVASHNHKLACRQCGQIVRWMSTARKHYKNHSGIGFKCVHCGMKFENYDARMNHIRTLHREVSCDICEMKIRGEAELARHKMEAHSELFKCPSCLVQFHNANALRRHAEATHTGCGAHIRPCTECGESNADDLQLEVHMLMKHTPQKRSRAPLEEGSRRRGQPGGPQKLICEICAREFKFQSELRAHQESKHSSGRPYVCDYCTSTFKTKMVLRTHILRVHSRPRYACPKPHCARVFRQVQHLDSHLLAHSNEKNFVCDICQVRFKHPASLSVHRQTIHEGKPARKRNRK
ncbi:zinc-finger associated domain (zf-AD) domain-containing protein [Phthorimaea operculella]|nr:zinc-finger associated domain (zf-AD) domain-containing protein [Phthorimaea operculella]